MSYVDTYKFTDNEIKILKHINGDVKEIDDLANFPLNFKKGFNSISDFVTFYSSAGKSTLIRTALRTMNTEAMLVYKPTVIGHSEFINICQKYLAAEDDSTDSVSQLTPKFVGMKPFVSQETTGSMLATKHYPDDVPQNLYASPREKKSRVVVIEDADIIMGKRKDGNLQMSEILNATSGVASDTKSKFIFSTNLNDVSDIDIGDDNALNQVFNNVKSSGKGGRVYKTGWKRLDKMLQGGFRPGLSMNAALQHKYKTGLNLSLFAQIPRFNRPYTTDPNKKPLILRISFEDEITNNLQFLYQYLKHCETREYIDIGDISAQDMTRYVKEKLQVNGFHVKMMRVDPTQWTYKSICNKIVELEAEGYVIEVLFLDYLAMVPTTGCITSGPMGTDIRDLYRRIRNFCASSRQMVVFTPHQLSTEAKRMIRAGVPEDQFVKEINEKGMFAGSGQLDQECDLIFYTHICKSNGVTYLTFQRDKHRLPTIIADENKYFVLRFPKGMPIPEDRDEEESGYPKVPRANTAQDELFNLG